MSAIPAPISPWPEPKDIPQDLEPVRAFDYDLLPAGIAPWVHDIAERMQCPPDYVAVAAMGCVSGAVGRRIAIQPKRHDDWTVYATVWALCVGRPGLMKSPAIAETMKPLKRLEAEARDAYDEAMEDFKLESKVAAARAKGAEQKATQAAKKGADLEDVKELFRSATAEEPVMPIKRRFTTTNATPEALGVLLQQNPTGLTVERDELAGLLKSFRKEGNEELRSMFLQGYDGSGEFTFDSIGRGLDLRVPAVWLSLVGAIQPGPLCWFIRDCLEDGGGDDGAIQRFGLMVWPDVSKGWRNVDRYPDTEAKNRAFEVIRQLSEIGAGAVDDRGLPLVHMMKFDNAGQEVFDSWRHDLEHELRSDTLTHSLEGHLAKYRKLMPTLALLCAVADGEREHVTERHALQGAAWCAYLRTHAKRMYKAASSAAETLGAAELLTKIRAGALGDQFTARDVQRKGWENLQDAEAVADALRTLVDFHHVAAEASPPGPGRPTKVYRVNPRTLEGGK